MIVCLETQVSFWAKKVVNQNVQSQRSLNPAERRTHTYNIGMLPACYQITLTIVLCSCQEESCSFSAFSSQEHL